MDFVLLKVSRGRESKGKAGMAERPIRAPGLAFLHFKSAFRFEKGPEEALVELLQGEVQLYGPLLDQDTLLAHGGRLYHQGYVCAHSQRTGRALGGRKGEVQAKCLF